MNFNLFRCAAAVLAMSVVMVLPVWADGTLTHLSGQVSVQQSDGKTLLGATGTHVGVGDTVITGQAGYVRVAMTDGGEMVLRPDSQLKIESYKFVKEAPAEDSFVFSMLKGGLRAITGFISKRGNRDAYKLRTATTTIGIRGTQFDVRVCLADCGALANGTYLAVHFGAVNASNTQGSLAVAAGQVAHVPPEHAPMLLPRNPGIGFTPPAVFPVLDEKKKLMEAAKVADQSPAINQAPGAQEASPSVATDRQGPGNEGSSQAAAPAAPVDGSCSVQ